MFGQTGETQQPDADTVSPFVSVTGRAAGQTGGLFPSATLFIWLFAGH